MKIAWEYIPLYTYTPLGVGGGTSLNTRILGVGGSTALYTRILGVGGSTALYTRIFP